MVLLARPVALLGRRRGQGRHHLIQHVASGRLPSGRRGWAIEIRDSRPTQAARHMVASSTCRPIRRSGAI
eukprot:SAG31_NODE_3249_length_4492_cov_15.130662_3_plen_70_part_00